MQNLTRQATAPSYYFVFITHQKDAFRLKGAICGNPGLQAGGMRTKTSPSGRRHLRTGCPPRQRLKAATSHNSQMPPFRRVSSSRRPGLPRSSPALKGGVTVKFAFQASYVFQASAVLLIQDTWEVPPKDFNLQKSFVIAPFIGKFSDFQILSFQNSGLLIFKIF